MSRLFFWYLCIATTRLYPGKTMGPSVSKYKYTIYRVVYLKSVLINAETLQKLVDNKTIFKQPYLEASSQFEQNP